MYVYLDKRKKPHIYRFQYTDHQGKRRTGTGTSSKTDTEKMAQIAQAKEDAIRKGWAEAPKPSAQHKHRAFKEVVEEYLSWGAAMGGRGGRPWGEEHLRIRRLWLEWWMSALSIPTLADLNGILPKVEKVLREYIAAGKAGKTAQNSAESLRAFCNWALERDYLEADPLEGLGGFDTTPKTTRRAMTAEEVQRLLKHCAPHRRLMYAVALSSGLRAKELRSLTVAHLDIARGGLILEAAWTKSRKAGFQPLPVVLMEHLKETFQDADRSTPLLNVPKDPDKALYRDMAKADIKKWLPGGKVDFHALRVAYVSFVMEAGANVKEAQSLARHSTPQLTLNVYAKARNERLAEVAEGVGKFTLPAQAVKVLEHTGTGPSIPIADERKTSFEDVTASHELELVCAGNEDTERVGFEPKSLQSCEVSTSGRIPVNTCALPAKVDGVTATATAGDGTFQTTSGRQPADFRNFCEHTRSRQEPPTVAEVMANVKACAELPEHIRAAVLVLLASVGK